MIVKEEFIKYLMKLDLYPQYIGDISKCTNFINILEDEYQQAFHSNPFDVTDLPTNIQLISSNLKLKDNSFALYNQKTGSGVPKAIMNKHFIHFLKTIHNEDKYELPIIQKDIKRNKMKELSVLKQKKQIILQGAPGTGKTYKAAELAVALCDDVDTASMNREDIMKRYRELHDEGRIGFVTFHQSMDYEEFVEGIKPNIDTDGNVAYHVIDGIFKSKCREADYIEVKKKKTKIRTYPSIWKVSLQGTGDNPIRSDCMKNNRIRIGWDGYGPTITDNTNYYNGGKNVLDAFINQMQIGDYVFSCYSARTIDAIGIITGDYEWLEDVDEYRRCRKVDWIVKGINEDIYHLNNSTLLTLSTVYKLNRINYDKLESITLKYKSPIFTYTGEGNIPYLLIIDEINRGNISKIFGELITLLEADKRIGEENELTVTLPYSQETFGVPNNLYIIGTMNTADRSVGYIDYAIRRRFAFITLKADRNVIENYYTDENLKQKALAYFDQVDDLMKVSSEYEKDDLMIGHSYFLAKDEEELQNKMVYEVRPLLLEYFNDGLLAFRKDDEEYEVIKNFGEA